MTPESAIEAATEAILLAPYPKVGPGTARNFAVLALKAARPMIEAEARHAALCWIQPDDGRLIACDRARDHKGAHSWDGAS